MPKQRFPVLLAYLRKDGHGLKAWCPFCRKWHLHGWGLGHRVAHCDVIESPFRRTGYELRAANRKIAVAVKGAETRLDSAGASR